MEKKWYQKTWFMWVMLVLFFPLGIFLLWKYSDYGKKAKIIITAIFVVLAIISMSGNKNNNQTNNPSTIKQEQTTSSPSTSSSSSSQQAKPTEQPKEQKPQVSQEFKNALRKAELYGKQMHMSKAGIYQQLTSEAGERFPADAAQYAIDNAKIDYKDAALKKAETYVNQMAMSRSAVYEQLISSAGEQFTPEEAQYAIDHLK